MVRDAVNQTGGPEKDTRKLYVRSAPDLVYFVLLLVLISIGSIMLFSAGSGVNSGSPIDYILGRLKHLGFGAAIALFIILAISPKRAKRWGLELYILSVVLLVMVLFIGSSEGEAKRWLYIGTVSVQPSELAKTALVLVLANYFSVDPERFRGKKGNVKRSVLLGYFIPLCIIGLICGLIVLEKHLSGMVIVLAISVFMMFIGGTGHVWIGLTGAAGAGAVWLYVKLVPYAADRIKGLFNRGSDADNDWQTKEGLYAMGNGGLFGRGIGNSVLKYGYISQAQNDFIFSVVCEELGFVGAVIIILLFLALTGRGFRLAQRTQDRFIALAIAGLSFKIILHVFLNIGVACALLPNTGISLPFFSSGGSATVTQLMDAGIILGLSRFSNN